MAVKILSFNLIIQRIKSSWNMWPLGDFTPMSRSIRSLRDGKRHMWKIVSRAGLKGLKKQRVGASLTLRERRFWRNKQIKSLKSFFESGMLINQGEGNS